MRGVWDPHVGPPQDGPGGFEDLSGPIVCTKNQPHLIILTVSSGAKFSLFLWVCGRSNGPVHLDLAKPRGHVYYRRWGFFWSAWMDWKVAPTRGAHYVHRAHYVDRAHGIIFLCVYML